MLFSGNRIKWMVETDKLVIEPFNQDQINPNSYNVRLHEKLLVYTDKVLDARKDNPTKEIIIPPAGLVLSPGELYLGRTVEYTETPNVVPMLEGRSSLARLGIQVHITAGFGDRGFKGHWTLEILAAKPVLIYPNMEIAQLSYQDVDQDGPIYRGKYNNSAGSEPEASKLHQDLHQIGGSPGDEAKAFGKNVTYCHIRVCDICREPLENGVCGCVRDQQIQDDQ